MKNGEDVSIRCSLEQFQKEVHATAKKNGYHDDNPNVFDCLLGISSEVDEACRAAGAGMFNIALSDIRGFLNMPRDKDVPEFLSIEVELGNIILRVLDLAEAHKLKVIDAMIAKAEYNKTHAKKEPPRP